MTVAELILELQFQNKDLEVYINRFKIYQEIEINLCVPELNDPYILISIKEKDYETI